MHINGHILPSRLKTDRSCLGLVKVVPSVWQHPEEVSIPLPPPQPQLWNCANSWRIVLNWEILIYIISHFVQQARCYWELTAIESLFQICFIPSCITWVWEQFRHGSVSHGTEMPIPGDSLTTTETSSLLQVGQPEQWQGRELCPHSQWSPADPTDQLPRSEMLVLGHI